MPAVSRPSSRSCHLDMPHGSPKVAIESGRPEKWLYFTDTADDSVGRVALE